MPCYAMLRLAVPCQLRLGRNKWDELGLSYPLEGVQPPGREAVLAVVDQLEAAGLAVMCDVKEQGTAKGIRVEG